MTDTPQTQLDKFKEAARELETDDDPERFKERLGRLLHKKLVREDAAKNDADDHKGNRE